MRNSFIQFAFFLLFCGLMIGACTHDPVIPEPEPTFCETTMPTYADSIKIIVDLTCSYTGCHAAGAGIGDFTNYAGMLSRLDNGKIEERVIDMRNDTMVGMPPFYASGQKDLTAHQLELFQCWLDNGHPEQ